MHKISVDPGVCSNVDTGVLTFFGSGLCLIDISFTLVLLVNTHLFMLWDREFDDFSRAMTHFNLTTVLYLEASSWVDAIFKIVIKSNRN